MNREEIKLLNEMKENCLNGAKYIDPKAMEKYNLLRKLEDENKELHNKIDIAMGILKTWKDFCEVRRKNCIDIDKVHWIYCIEKLEFLEEVLKDSDVDE